MMRKGGSACPKAMEIVPLEDNAIHLARELRDITVRRTMTLLDKLERRFGFLGIPGLIRIVI